MVSTTVTIDAAEMARMTKALTEVQTVLGRDAYQAVMYACVMVGRSGSAVSKPSKKSRPLIQNPNWRGKGSLFFAGSGGRWARRYIIDILRQPPKPPVRVFTDDANHKARRIEKSGLMRNVWRTLSGLAGSAKDKGMLIGKDERRLARMGVITSGSVTIANMRNLLKYFEEAYGGGALQTVYHNAASALNYKINDKLGVTVDRANRP